MHNIKLAMKNIAIVCGGYSGEFEISVQSATMIKQNLDANKYNSYIIIIEKDGWYYKDGLNKKHFVDKNNFTLSIDNKQINFDGVFNAIHGTPGEDGKLLGYFDMLNIPYSSCDMDASALTFNKYLCNGYVKTLGVVVANSLSFLKTENIDKNEVIKELGLPLFIKPVRSGSSVGISKVTKKEEFDAAVEHAFNTDNRILIEEFVDGREIACGLFTKGNSINVMPLTEIKSKNDFFDYEAKYTGGLADEVTPPKNLDIDDETNIKAISSLIYSKLGCKGIARVDFILTPNQLYFIEINTVPGFSPASIIPKQAKAMGISMGELTTTAVDNMFDIKN